MVDPIIKQKAEDIRHKIYGKEVRESLASGLEAMSDDVVEVTGRQATVETQFQAVLDETTGKDVISAPEIILARGGATTLGERLDESDEQLAQIATDPTFKASTATESATLGPELISGDGWTVPTGWTGNFASGFQNTVGNLNPLTFTMPESTGTKSYQVTFYVTSPTGAGVPNASTDYSVTVGNSDPFVTYNGGGSKAYAFGIRSKTNGNLSFIPGSTFDGKISQVSVKEIIGTTKPTIEILDKDDNSVLEIRTSKDTLKNIFIGGGSGEKNTTGTGNASLGDFTLKENTTGYWNTAFGREALRDNTVGSRNVAGGYLALAENVSGDRNVAIGTFALMRNTSGRQNIVLGADALWVNTTGSRNIAFGMGTMGSSVSGNENIAIGYAVMDRNIDGDGNIGIGFNALYENVSSHNNIAIGREALKKTKAAINIGIGFGTLAQNTEGASNIAIGASALSRSKLGSENAVFGHYAAGSGAYGDGISQNTIFGAWAGNKLTTGGDGNILIGYRAGGTLTTGTRNIMIGRFAGSDLTTESDRLVIGNAIYGNLATSYKKIGIGVPEPTATLHLRPSNGGAGSAPIKFEAGALTSGTGEAGALEFDGNDLYITTNQGVRHKLLKEVV